MMSAPSLTPTPLQIGLVLFPRVTQLDFTGPLQVFSSLPGATVHLIWKRIEPIASDSVLVLTPTTTFADCPQLDVICVPGGFVTAGIDFALTLVSLLHDRRTAEAIQLRLEYDPAPPFNSGSPDTAPPEVVAFMKDRIAQAQTRRGEMIDRAAARMG
jgi:transcriptional regulator GlxA family with amidase domain